MRRQIRGLSQAVINAQDGISLVQSAEGALHEVHDLLQRLNELSLKAANGTNSNQDRTYLQEEVAQLLAEVNRVGDTTIFNEQRLLDGSFGKQRKGGANSRTNLIVYDIKTHESVQIWLKKW